MVTRTGTDHQKGVDGVQPPSSIAPPERCIESVRSPYGHEKKRMPKRHPLFFMVTRTGIEPMLPP